MGRAALIRATAVLAIAGAGLWPHPEDSDANLNEVAGPTWIDDTGRRARDRLRAGASEAVISHCDWLAANLR